MSAHRFRLLIAGQVVVGLAFGSEAELAQFLAGRGIDLEASAPAMSTEPRGRGRPSKDKLLETAVAAFDLDTRHSNADQARQLRAHLEDAGLPPEELPSLRCVEQYLARRKLTKNPKRAKRCARRV